MGNNKGHFYRFIKNKSLLAAILIAFTVPALGFTDNDSPYKDECDPLLTAAPVSPGFKEELHEQTMQRHARVSEQDYRDVIYLGYSRTGDTSEKIKDVYCHEEFQIPGLSARSKARVNIEHTWPKSRFSDAYSRTTQTVDLHHLFVSNSHANSVRSSYPFGEVVNDTGDAGCAESKFGSDASGRTVFEPPAEHKGAVARALFYFSVRYLANISPAEEAILRQWHKQYPVTDAERERNSRIEKLQGNRNPFIDHPEYVDQIDRFTHKQPENVSSPKRTDKARKYRERYNDNRERGMSPYRDAI